MIAPNVDAYGTHARGSALADYLELLALHGHNISRAGFVDFVIDANWRLNAAENFVVPDEPDDDEAEPDERVYNLIYTRRAVLGTDYPFTLDDSDRLAYTPQVEPDVYSALLSLTIAHAYGVATPHDPKHVFEEAVTTVLTGRGWLGVNLGALRRGSANFAEALADAGEILQIPATADAAPHNKKAQDEGVDSVHHIPWCVTRQGRWVVLGQSTCAVSNDWYTKLMDPKPGIWSPMLGEILLPWVFLAVPHHAEPSHRRYLIQASQRLLLDRLSLVVQKQALSAEEQAIHVAVLADGVEQP